MLFRADACLALSTVTIGFVLALGGCSTVSSPAGPQVYDFGPKVPMGAISATTQQKTVVVEPVSAAKWLDSPAIVFRFQYADAQQARHYANSEWSAPPAELLTQRLESRLAEHANVVAIGDAPGNPILKVELGEFSQVFDTEGTSHVTVEARATLFKAGRLVGQRSSTMQSTAASADARGAAHALAEVAEKAIDAIVQWSVPLL